MSANWTEVSTDQVELGLILGDWTNSRGPLHARLAARLREAIARGDLPTGTRLPPERLAAERLAISRGTLAAAYKALAEEGYLEQRQGSGTRVAGQRTTAGRAPSVGAALTKSAALLNPRNGSPEGEPLVDLGPAVVGGISPIVEAVLRDSGPDIARLVGTEGYAPFGYEPLREAIAGYLTARGTTTAPDQVLVTNGAQQAISLLAAHLLQPGDSVLLEDPTFTGAIGAFGSAGARLVGVDTGRHGVDLRRLGELMRHGTARLAYVIATYNNPTGGTLSEAGRIELARLAETTGVLVVEDESLVELSLGVAPPPSIASIAARAPVLSVGSFSKLFWGGLRVGWVRGPEEEIAALGRLKTAIDLGGSLPSQILALRLLDRVDELREERRATITARLALMEALLAEHLPDWRWERPGGGLCLWVRLPGGWAADFALVARRFGVAVVPGPIASPENGCASYVRLPFAHEPAVLEEGVTRLTAAWAAYARTAGQERPKLSLVV